MAEEIRTARLPGRLFRRRCSFGNFSGCLTTACKKLSVPPHVDRCDFSVRDILCAALPEPAPEGSCHAEPVFGAGTMRPRAPASLPPLPRCCPTRRAEGAHARKAGCRCVLTALDCCARKRAGCSLFREWQSAGHSGHHAARNGLEPTQGAGEGLQSSFYDADRRFWDN